MSDVAVIVQCEPPEVVSEDEQQVGRCFRLPAALPGGLPREFICANGEGRRISFFTT